VRSPQTQPFRSPRLFRATGSWSAAGRPCVATPSHRVDVRGGFGTWDGLTARFWCFEVDTAGISDLGRRNRFRHSKAPKPRGQSVPNLPGHRPGGWGSQRRGALRHGAQEHTLYGTNVKSGVTLGVCVFGGNNPVRKSSRLLGPSGDTRLYPGRRRKRKKPVRLMAASRVVGSVWD
jgi:hypothetical protein